jgi:hypothetical protein
MSEIEIYDCVRQFWYCVAASRRTRHESGKLLYPIALGIADGVVLRAYSIAEWLPGGSTRPHGGGKADGSLWAKCYQTTRSSVAGSWMVIPR